MKDWLNNFESDAEQILEEVLAARLDNPRSRRLRREIVRRFAALLLTDDERARLLGLPEGCRVRESAKIIGGERLKCDGHVWIGENAVVDASGGLEIGEHTTIGTGAFVWSHTSVLASLLHDNRSGNDLIVRKPTRIGRGVYVGGPSVVNPGIDIGEGAVILPMTVVTRDVTAGKIVAGSPGRERGDADAEFVARLRRQL